MINFRFLSFFDGVFYYLFTQYGLGMSDRTRSEWTRTFGYMV